jgi:hypothetical protein
MLLAFSANGMRRIYGLVEIDEAQERRFLPLTGPNRRSLPGLTREQQQADFRAALASARGELLLVRCAGLEDGPLLGAVWVSLAEYRKELSWDIDVAVRPERVAFWESVLDHAPR